MHTYRPDLPRRICETMMHDPLYDTPERWEKWLIVLAAVIAGLIIACVIFAGASPAPPKPEPAPPAAIPDFRTDIPTGRMVCEKRDAAGCLEWRIYRESKY